MTRPLPELLRPNERKVWRTKPPTHLAHERTATPHRHKINAHPQTSQIDQDTQTRDNLTALIGSKYNTRRLRDLARIANPIKPDPQLITASEELRNRYLLTQTPTGATLPQARYYLPEQLANHHADPKTKRNLALDLASLIHHKRDTATYLKQLAIKSPALAEHAGHVVTAIRTHLDHLTTHLRNNPAKLVRASTWENHGKIRNYRLTLAEDNATDLARLLNNYATQHERLTRQDANARRKKQRETRRTETTAHANRPNDSDALDGWHTLVPCKPPREVAHLGRLGRKRTVSDTGKTPNRIANYCGDPLRRIYTRKTRGTNALVVVDMSGSMSLDESDLDQILRASCGATVVGYSADNDTDPNLFLLAHNSRRVRTMPETSGGNGIDAPAMSWAIKHYRKHNAPVLWITDGAVTGRGDVSSRNLRDQCRRLAHKYGITVAKDVPQALRNLATIQAGKRPEPRHYTFNR